MNRIYALLVVSVFLLGMLGPLAVYLFSVDKKVSIAEKRELVTFPDIDWDYQKVIAFPKKFDAYYQDHFGFRDVMVTFYNTAKLNIFGVTSSSRVMKGKENWFFLIGAYSNVSDFYGMNQVTPAVLDDYAQVLVERRDWLESMGIRYLFLPIPNKISVYPEKLPDRIQKLAGPIFYQQFTDYLAKTVGNDIFVDTLSLLEQKKDVDQVYLSTDTHWTPIGALETFNKIMRQLKVWFPSLEEISATEIKLSEIRHSGDLAYMMHLEKVVSEVATLISIREPCATGGYQNIPAYLYQLLPKRRSNAVPVQNGCSERELTALIINDSFGKALRPFFNERFKQVVYSNQYDFNSLKDLIVALRPDVVVDERVARNLTQALRHDSELEARLLKKQFDQSDKIVFDLLSNDNKKLITTQFDVEISRHKDGYALLPKSNDPNVIIAPGVLPGGRYSAMIELSTPEDNVLEVFYKPVGVTQYQGRYSFARKIKKGYNKLYFRFPDVDIENEIRLDPGLVPVDSASQARPYILHAFMIKDRR